MPLTARLYIGAVTAIGLVILLVSVPQTLPQPALAATFVAAMLAVSIFKLRLPLGEGQSTMSMAYVVDFAVLAAAGVELAVAIAAIGVLAQCTVNVGRRQPWYRTAFSVAAVVIGVRTAGLVWAAFDGATAATVVVPLVLAAIPYYVVNSGLVAGAIGLSSGSSPVACWRQHFMRTAPTCLLAAAIVGSLHLAATGDVYLLLASAAAPTAMCYFAYAAWFKRLSTQTAALA
jgi:hypothetical protein